MSKSVTLQGNCRLKTYQSFVGLGSNLQDPVLQVDLATKRLRELDNIELVAQSSVYQSPPMGPQDQADYINVVLELRTSLSPLALLGELQAIENQFGRDRSVGHWGPRIIDLDILLYANREIDLKRLQIPHPGLCEREFMVIPLLEIAPTLSLLGGKRLLDSLGKMNTDMLQKL